MANKQVKHNNQQKGLLDYCENIALQHTLTVPSYFVYTEDVNITQVKVYGKKQNIQVGCLLHIDGYFSSRILHDILPTNTSLCVFFVITNVCWNSQISAVKNTPINHHLIIITNGLPADLLDMNENQINTLLTEKNITLIINEDGRLMSSQYNYQRCVLLSNKNENVINDNNINNLVSQHQFIRMTAQEALLRQQSNNTINTNITTPHNEVFFLKKSHLQHNIPTEYVAMTANNVVKTKHIGIFKSHNTILIPNYGISPLAIKILNYYFNIHIIPLTYDVERYLSANNSPKMSFNGIVLPTSLQSNIDTDIQNKISALVATKKPILTFGYGSSILADIMNFSITKETKIAKVNNYQIYDNYNNTYNVSMIRYCYFNDVPYGYHMQFYDQNNHNVVGIETNVISAYTFDCINNTTYTARILDKFDRKMNEANKR